MLCARIINIKAGTMCHHQSLPIELCVFSTPYLFIYNKIVSPLLRLGVRTIIFCIITHRSLTPIM